MFNYIKQSSQLHKSGQNYMEKEKTIIIPNRDSEPEFITLDNDRTRIGKQIAELRSKMGISQEKLSELSGVGSSHIARIEKGLYSVGIDTLSKIAGVFGKELVFQEKVLRRPEKMEAPEDFENNSIPSFLNENMFIDNPVHAIIKEDKELDNRIRKFLGQKSNVDEKTYNTLIELCYGSSGIPDISYDANSFQHHLIAERKMLHTSGVIGWFVREYHPTGKPLTTMVHCEDGKIFFAPSNEFREI